MATAALASAAEGPDRLLNLLLAVEFGAVSDSVENPFGFLELDEAAERLRRGLVESGDILLDSDADKVA